MKNYWVNEKYKNRTYKGSYKYGSKERIFVLMTDSEKTYKRNNEFVYDSVISARNNGWIMVKPNSEE